MQLLPQPGAGLVMCSCEFRVAYNLAFIFDAWTRVCIKRIKPACDKYEFIHAL